MGQPDVDASQTNYRPVSNLSFLSKLLDRIVQICFQTFLGQQQPGAEDTVCILSVSQHRQSETVVTMVYNGLLWLHIAANGGQLSVLCLLAGFVCCIEHGRPRSADAATGASVWSPRCRGQEW